MIPGELLFLVLVAGALFATGLAALIARGNLIKMIIGLELMGKGVSLLFITGGYLSGDTGISQAVVFNLIVIEAVVAGVALVFVILAKQVWSTLDVGAIESMTRRDD